MEISRRVLLRGAGTAALGGFVTAAAAQGSDDAWNGRMATAAGSTATIPVTSRNSVFTRGGSGPLSWTTYGWCFPNDAPIPESVWQQNIDWMADSLAPYGFTMASTDGWTLDNQATNDHGYVISYNPSWTHDWAYWADYLARRNMKLGVYYNPLWVCGSAVNDPAKTVVGRPDIPVSAIVNSGDLFNGNPKRYWVDVTKDGAKEFVQGYVEHFKKAGAAYLRIDFLAWYESGWDQNMGTVGVAHGSENYATALQWMNEAAGDEIELSLVMPNLNGHGANELRHGDMVRINDDAGKGGWDRLSGGRQSWQPYWTQWHNPFAGFTGFSDRSGRGQLILDGDFLMMNSFANDDERRTAINLFTIAGSPIAVADRHDNIGPYATFYRNPEVLRLQHEGLVGKPYYNNGNPYQSDPSSRDSERWMGQLPDGTWVVALFNRSDGPGTVTKSIGFKDDLGIKGPARVRDLWAHADLGARTGITATLDPHASRLVTIAPDEPGTRRYQAEFAGRSGGAVFGNDHSGYSATGFVTGMDADGAKVVFAIDAPSSGTYTVQYRYANATGATSTLTVVTEDAGRNPIGGPHQLAFREQPDWNTWATVTGRIALRKGTNLLTVAHTSSDTGNVHLDAVELHL